MKGGIPPFLVYRGILLHFVYYIYDRSAKRPRRLWGHMRKGRYYMTLVRLKWIDTSHKLQTETGFLLKLFFF